MELLVAIELGMIYGLVALGVYIAFDVLGFSDLTCDGSFALGGVVAVVLNNLGLGVFSSLCVAVVSGAIAGMCTALLNCYCKMSDLLAGIVVAFMLYSMNLRVMGGVPNVSVNVDNVFMGNYSVQYVLMITLVAIGVLVIIMKSDFGLGLASLGQNKFLAESVGICSNHFIIAGLAIANGLIAFGGAIFSYTQSFADVSQGMGAVIFGLAAVTVGEVFFFSARVGLISRLFACVLGAILYRIVVAIAVNSDFLGVKAQDINLITGGIVILIILLKKRANVKARAC